MKKILTATRSQHTESYVHEEKCTGTSAYRRSERKFLAWRQYVYVENHFESGGANDPPTDSEIVLCKEPMGRLPRLRGDRTEGLGA